MPEGLQAFEILKGPAILAFGQDLVAQQLLGVHGPVDGDEIGAEVVDFLQVFEADDGEVRGGETVLAGVLGGAGLALWGAGAGRVGRVGAISPLFSQIYWQKAVVHGITEFPDSS
jgi:hypothetical protein